MKMAVNIQMSIRKNMLFVRLKGELDQAVTEKLKIRISELIDKYEIKYLIFNTLYKQNVKKEGY